jgi:hypothetical protein
MTRTSPVVVLIAVVAATVGIWAVHEVAVPLGILAVMAAVGGGGGLHGSTGVLEWVATQPFGRVLLVVAGVGFFCDWGVSGALAVIAAGLTAYGVLNLFFARYRRLSLGV